MGELVLARTPGAISRAVGDEFVVIDPKTDTAHALAGPLAQVWREADGDTTPQLVLSEAERSIAIAELQGIGLLRSSGLDRRALMKRGGAVGGLVVGANVAAVAGPGGLASILLPNAAANASQRFVVNGPDTLEVAVPTGFTRMSFTVIGGAGGGRDSTGGRGATITGTFTSLAAGTTVALVAGGGGLSSSNSSVRAAGTGTGGPSTPESAGGGGGSSISVGGVLAIIGGGGGGASNARTGTAGGGGDSTNVGGNGSSPSGSCGGGGAGLAGAAGGGGISLIVGGVDGNAGTTRNGGVGGSQGNASTRVRGGGGGGGFGGGGGGAASAGNAGGGGGGGGNRLGTPGFTFDPPTPSFGQSGARTPVGTDGANGQVVIEFFP